MALRAQYAAAALRLSETFRDVGGRHCSQPGALETTPLEDVTADLTAALALLPDAGSYRRSSFTQA